MFVITFVAEMKKMIVYFLLSGFLLSGTDIGQVLKTPFLFHHLNEHRSENPALGFSDFLQIHFVTPESHEQHHDHDPQLPFKNHDCSHHSEILKIFCRKTSAANMTPFVCSHGLSATPARDQLPPSNFFSDIWNPPKA